MPDNKKETEALERLLRRSGGVQEDVARAERRGDCAPAEVLAAFYERALAPDERSRWEAHLADCPHCRTALAALVRSEPAATALAPARSWWRFLWPERAELRWLVPAAAVALLAVWLGVRAPAPDAPMIAQHIPPAATEETPRELRREAETAAPPTDAAEPETGRPGRTRRPLPASPPGREPSQPAEPPAATPDARPAAPARERAEVREEARLSAIPAPAEAAPAPAAVGRAAQLAVKVQPAQSVVVHTSVAGWLWRVGPAGRIERSADGGQTWLAQNSGVEADLLAGSATSETVCWAVGRAGTVLRTTDGETWERRTAPAEEDLIGVEAEDAERATVTTASGRTYRTSDGGRTWQTP